MKKQEYLLKKYVWARTAAEALAQDSTTDVSEVHLVADKPEKLEPAVGFKFLYPDE